jgi:DMSO/TMAO reductase YedYZ molybdopterin-dependent catalytic subunit
LEVGLLLTAPLIAVFYAAYRLLDLPFVPFDVFDWVARVLPGPIITFGIDLMIDTLRALNIEVADAAKSAEQFMAIAQVLVPAVLAGGAFFAILNRREDRTRDLWPGVIMGLLFGLPTIAISTSIGISPVNPVLRALWILALFVGWGAAFSWLYNELSTSPRTAGEAAEPMSVKQIGRREFLIRAGMASAAITVVGTGVGVALASAERRRREAALADTMAHDITDDSVAMLPNSDDPVTPAPGTRPEYTPLQDHYKVFIRTEPSVVDGSTWILPVAGMVEKLLMLRLDDLQNNYTEAEQYVTLSCISGRVGTGLIGTTLWTGVSLQEVLSDAGLMPGARYLHITSVDGFYETVDLDLVMADERIMLTYSWDGGPLSVEHGFPLRIYIPDRYGMKQPKWITGLEVTDEYQEGYWVERGWDEVAQMNATSVIDTVAVDAVIEERRERLVPIGGIAHAGARGISKVEVRVDDGPWQAAQLREPLSEVTWVVWRFDWPFEEGEHTFEVRCAEGDGTPQIEEVREARPSGSTGIHSVEEAV